MQKILIIVNDAPYGTEKAYNAFRMAMTLQKEHKDVVDQIESLIMGKTANTPTEGKDTADNHVVVEAVSKAN